jgi:hypothetical protein
MTIGLDTTFLVQHDVREAPLHEWARTYLVASVLEAGNTPGLCPQVLAEYLHVITDPARFEHPLTMPAALSRAAVWWSLPGMRGVFPTRVRRPGSSRGWGNMGWDGNACWIRCSPLPTPATGTTAC